MGVFVKKGGIGGLKIQSSWFYF